MSAIKIVIRAIAPYYYAIPRTNVEVDGKFAYQSGNHTTIEKEHIEKLISLLYVENTEVEIKPNG